MKKRIFFSLSIIIFIICAVMSVSGAQGPGQDETAPADVQLSDPAYTEDVSCELMIGKFIGGCDPKLLEGESFVYEIRRDDGEVFYEVLNFDGTGDTVRRYITGLRPGTYTVRELSGWSWEYTSDPEARETGMIDSYEGKGGSLLDGQIIFGTADEEVTYGHVSFYGRVRDEDLLSVNDSAYFVCGAEVRECD